MITDQLENREAARLPKEAIGVPPENSATVK
jgi:hypothetical protein